MHVLVAGGTGGLGRLVVNELVGRGHQVRVLSRQLMSSRFAEPNVEVVRGDLATGHGIAAAVAGVQTVLAHFARIWSAAARNRPRPTVTIPVSGSLGRRLRQGAPCNVDQAVGATTFQQWATRQIGGESHA